MKKIRTRHSFFSMSGLTARALILASKMAPDPMDLAVAACFGIVEVLGAKRLFKVFRAAFKQQLKKMLQKGGPDGR